MPIAFFIFISMGVFVIGVFGVLTKRNPLILFLSIELMLNAVNFLFVVFAYQWDSQNIELISNDSNINLSSRLGLVWVLFIFVVAAVEAAIGLAMMMNIFRKTKVADVDRYDLLKG